MKSTHENCLKTNIPDQGRRTEPGYILYLQHVVLPVYFS